MDTNHSISTKLETFFKTTYILVDFVRGYDVGLETLYYRVILVGGENGDVCLKISDCPHTDNLTFIVSEDKLFKPTTQFIIHRDQIMDDNKYDEFIIYISGILSAFTKVKYGSNIKKNIYNIVGDI